MRIMMFLLVLLAFAAPVSGQVTDDIRKSAEAGDPKAQYEMGRQLERAKFSANEIIDWYKKAAEQGYLPAQEVLALIYSKDTYVSHDFVVAYKWCFLAAQQNGPVGSPMLEVLKEMMTAEQIENGEKLALEWLKNNPRR